MFELLSLIALLTLMSWSAWIDTVWIAAIGMVLYLIGGWLFGDLSHLTFLADPVTLLSSALLFLVIGALWSLWKWRRWMLSASVQDALRAGKDEHDRYHGDEPFKEHQYFPDVAKASNNVDRIVTWIILWPFSVAVYFFQDLLADVGRWIYERLGRVYVRITDAALPDDMK